MGATVQNINEALFQFIKDGPTSFHTVDAISQRLEKEGFTKLNEEDHWELEAGGRYYVTRNSSSIIGFSICEKYRNATNGFRVVASHSDSPCYKIKPKGELSDSSYIRLNTEGYGGMICYSWLDRPLSVAGRVIIKDSKEGLIERLVNIDRELLVIPSLAVHMNRKVNSGMEFNLQKDMIPLLADKGDGYSELDSIIADALGVAKENIYGEDLFLYNRSEGTVWGANNEYISAPMIDDLQCAYASLQGFLENNDTKTISVYACFDNEEVGSTTLQGAASSFLQDTLERIADSLGLTAEDYHRMLANSWMLSEDNGHAVHPNHPEKTDADNHVYMNGGIVIKSHAGQKYTTNALGVALCRDICEKLDIPYQFFANRSDEAGGSTLGNIASSRVPIKTVDIGLAQLAMHSSYETAGAKDTEYMIKFNKGFFEY